MIEKLQTAKIIIKLYISEKLVEKQFKTKMNKIRSKISYGKKKNLINKYKLYEKRGKKIKKITI